VPKSNESDAVKLLAFTTVPRGPLNVQVSVEFCVSESKYSCFASASVNV
jgi:hypothetical protein